MTYNQITQRLIKLENEIEGLKSLLNKMIESHKQIRVYSKLKQDPGDIQDAMEFIKCYCNRMYIKPEILISKSRNNELCEARYPIYWYLYYEYGLSLTTIATIFNRTHTTIMAGKNTFESERELYKKFDKHVTIIQELIAKRETNLSSVA